jgi:tetratricopeptide (TPR) repeat protein
MVAHHYLSALEYARAADVETEALRERARAALAVAGERAATLGAWTAARRFLSAALELWAPDDPLRLDAQALLGRALRWTGELTEELIQDRRDAALAAGRDDLVAEAEMAYAFYWWDRSRFQLVDEHMHAALALVADKPSSPSKASIFHQVAIRELVAGNLRSSKALAEQAAGLAREFGLTAVHASALITRGSASFAEGDLAGIADIERGLALGEEHGLGDVFIRGFKNLGDAVQRNGELARAVKLHEKGLQNARQLGDRFHVRWFSAELAFDRYLQGRWDEALSLADELIAQVEAGEPHYMESGARYVRALIALARGDVPAAIEDSKAVLAQGRGAAEPQVLHPALALGSRVALAAGRRDEAERLFEELEAAAPERVEAPSPGISSGALVAGEFARVSKWASPGEPQTPWGAAARAAARGEFAEAADVYASIGARPDEADARLAAARKLVAEGRRAEADEQLRRALAFYREVRATAYLREAESLLAASA